MKKLIHLASAALASMFVGSVAPVAADPLSDMISPVSNPVNFEDPRINSELRAIYAYHKLDNKFVTQGGDVRIYALQARYALTDSLALLATKDGWVDFNPDAVLVDKEGFGNVTVGAKYALHQDKDAGSIATVGFRYEIPLGDEDVFQGYGKGYFNPFFSGAMAVGPVNVMVGTGFRIAGDSKDSSFYDADISLSTKLGNFYPAFEVNLVHVFDAGTRLGIADEGQDYFNFGASESDGENIITAAAGARYRFCDGLDWGVSYQFPLNSGTGSRIIDYRVLTDLIVSFGK